MDTNLILDEIKGKLPKGKIGKATMAELKSRLDSLSDSQRSDAFLKIQGANLKNPNIVFWIGNFLLGNFGVGRFMIGDYIIGVIRLVLSLIVVVISEINDGSEAMKIIGISFLILMWGWYFADWFLVNKKVRMQNLRKVLLAIDSVKSK